MEALLNVSENLMAFVAVVEAGGFTAASHQSGIPKSRLSRRVAELEAALGVSLIRRDSRHFSVTELGDRIFSHGLDVRAETRKIMALAHDNHGIPSGHLRIACPSAIANALVSRIAIEFVKRHPRVTLSLQTTDGTAGSADEATDLCIQPANRPLADSGMVARKLGDTPYALVAAPSLIETLGDLQRPEMLAGCPGIGWSFTSHLSRWPLTDAQGQVADAVMDIRFSSDSLLSNRDAALQGLGVAQLPLIMCEPYLANGQLATVVPDWRPPNMVIYAIYPSRRHLTLAGRAFLDYLATTVEGVFSAHAQAPA